MTRHTDLDLYIADKRDDTDATLECYFEPYSCNLFHVYVGDFEINLLLSDTVIQSLEREYEKHCMREREEEAANAAVDRYESKMLDHVMNRQDWQPKLDALRIRS
jgi:hypothetical protein